MITRWLFVVLALLLLAAAVDAADTPTPTVLPTRAPPLARTPPVLAPMALTPMALQPSK